LRFPRVPSGVPGYQFLNEMVRVLTSELAKRTPDDTSRRSVYLTSPDGSVWEVTINNTGVLETTKVSG
jgi:hypothetical protein